MSRIDFTCDWKKKAGHGRTSCQVTTATSVGKNPLSPAPVITRLVTAVNTASAFGVRSWYWDNLLYWPKYTTPSVQRISKSDQKGAITACRRSKYGHQDGNRGLSSETNPLTWTCKVKLQTLTNNLQNVQINADLEECVISMKSANFISYCELERYAQTAYVGREEPPVPRSDDPGHSQQFIAYFFNQKKLSIQH